MSQSPAAYLRALDRTATPDWKFEGSEYIAAGPRGLKRSRPNGEVIAQFRPSISDLLTNEEKLGNAKTAVSARNLLPALADVVEAADELTDLSGDVTAGDRYSLEKALARLAAAVADVEGGR